jgi:selenium metabolism protein YedF
MDNLVIQITTNTYGKESEGLGESLMKAYIFALTETTPYPKSLMFINKGAFLTAKDSPVLDSLEKLEAEGVEILTCGTCIVFFNLNKAPVVGTVTNMYEMAEKLNNADNAIVI